MHTESICEIPNFYARQVRLIALLCDLTPGHAYTHLASGYALQLPTWHSVILRAHPSTDEVPAQHFLCRIGILSSITRSHVEGFDRTRIMTLALLFYITGLFTLPYLVESSNCYSRNGTLITDIAYQPCSSSGDSACCGTNHDGAGHVGIANDVCDANGLCQNFEPYDGTNEGVKMWWRQGCTDSTWSSPNCLASVCDTLEYENDNAPVYSCGDNSWVCGRKSYCSSTSRLFTLAATVGKEAAASTSVSVAVSTKASSNIASLVTSTAGSVSASAPIASTASSSIGSATGAPPLSNIINAPAGLSTAAKAGIGAGIAVVILLLGIILLLLHKVKKGKKQQEAFAKAELSGQSVNAAGKPEAIVYAHEVSYNPVEMADNGSTMQEMYAHRERTELESQERAHEAGQGIARVELDERGRYA